MIEYRCFRNNDPPHLAEVWRSADLGPLAMQPMTTADLEAGVFSKPYFDRRGLIIAVEEAGLSVLLTLASGLRLIKKVLIRVLDPHCL